MHPIKKLLIANRGEIARRIIRSARQMGIKVCTLYTQEEKDALHVKEADEAFSLGEGSILETYLNITKIISIARDHRCDAIHPGYGFLSENAAFAEACEKAGIIFIGPHSEVIRLMGNKLEARRFVESLGVPLIPIFKGASYEEISQQVKKASFPLLIKAAAGGGGKGMKIVRTENELNDAYDTASREAHSYFGDSTVYIEKYLENPRHIEVQILGDSHGNVIHLFERECTIQRRHQKIIEEAPSPTLDEETREKILSTAITIATALNYTNAGTLEFIFDSAHNFYFLEMNTRIQVEHPVTEAITGIDIVKEQINIAMGHSISFDQTDIKINGHAIECRLYAEDPFNQFLPSAGEMNVLSLPAGRGIRIDSAYDEASVVPSSFDPMLTKIISHDTTRANAIENLLTFFENTVVHGIKTNLEYLKEVFLHSRFTANELSTAFCAQESDKISHQLKSRKEEINFAIIAASFLAFYFKNSTSGKHTIWQTLGPWRAFQNLTLRWENSTFAISVKHPESNRILFSINTISNTLENIQIHKNSIHFKLNGHLYVSYVSKASAQHYSVSFQGLLFELTHIERDAVNSVNNKDDRNGHSGENIIRSPLNGKVVKCNVKTGDKVNKGDTLLIIESMKTENRIMAPFQATVEEVAVSAGDQVSGSEMLIKLQFE